MEIKMNKQTGLPKGLTNVKTTTHVIPSSKVTFTEGTMPDGRKFYQM